MRWAATGAPTALGLYSLYIALLAVNGILETYVHAVASAALLARANLWLAASSIVHIVLSVVMVRRAGAVGLIVADMANMMLRIACSLGWLRTELQCSSPGAAALREMVPATRTLRAMGIAFIIAGVSNIVIMQEGGLSLVMSGYWPICKLGFWPWAGLHVLIGSSALAMVGMTVWRAERATWNQLLRYRAGKHDKSA